MKHIYLPNFETYRTAFIGGLVYERVGKLPIVKVSRHHGDLPFFDYFKMRVFFSIGSRLKFIADAIDYRVRVSAGMDKTWRCLYPTRHNGLRGYSRISPQNPPTQKVVKNGFIVRDTGKARISA